MDKSLLIVGVDPGTTLGYALLDISGNIVKLRSSKQLDLNTLISEIVKEGHPIAVGTDRKYLPDFISKFSTKIGAKIIIPQEDMPVGYKKNLTREHSRAISDEHQRDALASAIFAFRKLRPLINKIGLFVEKNGKERLRQDLISLVVKNDISLNYALEILEKPAIEENKIIKKAIEENKFDRDFLKLYDRLKGLQRENKLIKEQNKKIKVRLAEMRRSNENIRRKMDHLEPDEKARKQLRFKEERILFMDRELQMKDEKINSLHDEVNALHSMIADLGDNVLVKKIKNLGWSEVEAKNKILKINKGDILLVEDPSIFSDKSVSFLRNRVDLIVYKASVSKQIQGEFVFINAKKLNLRENKYFAVINKKELERIKREENLLDRVLSSYRERRN